MTREKFEKAQKLASDIKEYKQFLQNLSGPDYSNFIYIYFDNLKQCSTIPIPENIVSYIIEELRKHLDNLVKEFEEL